MELAEEFEDRLMDLITEFQKRGLSAEDISSVLELQSMAVEETSGDRK